MQSFTIIISTYQKQQESKYVLLCFVFKILIPIFKRSTFRKVTKGPITNASIYRRLLCRLHFSTFLKKKRHKECINTLMHLLRKIAPILEIANVIERDLIKASTSAMQTRFSEQNYVTLSH